ncbi:serine beta-lactamase-like protein LACTB, mitochondrial [Tigriopus californicus]|uniref:serine beta-lactamase-like protein LACTB, mitochondrial n=1 Tax=Tigriopus californicus TaxID=6832 RepID=UPI0027DA10D5|nr:serine beta-lactamase-like protein LACTB, mitochondrial [Tigriopus californicus]
MYFSTGLKVAAAGSSIIAAGAVTVALRQPHLKADGDPTNLDLNENLGNKAVQAKFNKAKGNCNNLVWMKMNESSTPCLILGVALDGKVVYKHGYGFADVEKRVLATPETTMRIASISKSLTMTAVAKLVEEGKIDLDKPVIEYVPSWPQSHPAITTRQIVSHLSGIRHYLTKEQIETQNSADSPNGQGDSQFKEFHMKDKFESVEKALEIFKGDELLSNPGDAFHYTTHGYTLLSAIVEKASGEKFEKHMKRMFRDLGLQSTYLDENEPIIPNRASQYVRDKRHALKNAPHVDNSCKWAGGGFLSNIGDLLKFGNAMLYSYQSESLPETTKSENVEDSDKTEVLGNEKEKLNCREIVYNASPYSPVNRSGRNPNQSKRRLNGFLKKQTVDQIWNPVVRMGQESSLNDDAYAMGWMVKPEIHDYAYGRKQELTIYHTGGAVGGSSVLLICPKERKTEKGDQNEKGCPQGVVVTILCNLEGVSLTKLAMQIADEFQGLRTEAPHKVVKVYDC